MSPVDVPPPDPAGDERDRRQHDLLQPLTAISGRAQLLGRMVRRSPSARDGERGAMLAGLAIVIEFNRMVGGKVAEHWVELDLLGLLGQLGAIPTPGMAGS